MIVRVVPWGFFLAESQFIHYEICSPHDSELLDLININIDIANKIEQQ